MRLPTVILSEEFALRKQSKSAVEGSLSPNRNRGLVKEFLRQPSTRPQHQPEHRNRIPSPSTICENPCKSVAEVPHSHCELCRFSHQHAEFPCCGKIDRLHVC